MAREETKLGKKPQQVQQRARYCDSLPPAKTQPQASRRVQCFDQFLLGSRQHQANRQPWSFVQALSRNERRKTLAQTQRGMGQQRKQRFNQLLSPTCNAAGPQEMKGFCQHGSVSTYQHCLRVSWRSYRLNQVLHADADEQALVRAAFLHDYYGYDWHNTTNKLHAVNHPCIAAQRAKRDFDLSDKECSIIRSHMWPLPPTRIPCCREAWLVCAADKICALEETLFKR